MNKRWIVTVVDYGETCDGKARVLEVCKSEEEAKAFVRNDIEEWADHYAGEEVHVDFNRMSAQHYGYNNNDGCEWNIQAVEV